MWGRESRYSIRRCHVEGLPSEARSTRSTGDQPAPCVSTTWVRMSPPTPSGTSTIQSNAARGRVWPRAARATRCSSSRAANSSRNSTLRYKASRNAPCIHSAMSSRSSTSRLSLVPPTGRLARSMARSSSMRSNWACFRATSNRKPSTRSSAALAPAPLAMGHSDSRSCAVPNGAPASSGMTVTRDASIGEKLRARTCSPALASALQVTTAASRYRTTRSTSWAGRAQFMASKNRMVTRRRKE